MATPRQLYTLVADITGMKLATVETAWVALRSAGLVSAAEGKGKAAPVVTAFDAATLLTAICGCVRIADAVAVVKNYEPTSFIHGVARLIESGESARVEIHAEQTLAVINDTKYWRKAVQPFRRANSSGKHPIEGPGDMFFIRGFTDKTLRAISDLLNAPAT